MVGTELLSLLHCYTTRCVNRRIHKDSTNPGHHLLKLLSWVRWFRAIPSYTNRLKQLLPKSCWSQFVNNFCSVLLFSSTCLHIQLSCQSFSIIFWHSSNAHIYLCIFCHLLKVHIILHSVQYHTTANALPF